MQTAQQPSTFAQIIDKLRHKSEEELKLLYMQLSVNEEMKQSRMLAEDYNESYTAQKRTKKEKVTEENSLNKVFGIWENENITLDSIREKAWQRTK